MITVDTDLGTIKVAKSVIGSLIMTVIDSFDGKVIISNSKGRIPNQFAKKIGPKEEFNEIDIDLTENGLDLKINVVLKFGTSIKAVTERMIGDIRSSVKESTGMTINEITIVITGMMSKHIAPRHIEVKG